MSVMWQEIRDQQGLVHFIAQQGDFCTKACYGMLQNTTHKIYTGICLSQSPAAIYTVGICQKTHFPQNPLNFEARCGRAQGLKIPRFSAGGGGRGNHPEFKLNIKHCRVSLCLYSCQPFVGYMSVNKLTVNKGARDFEHRADETQHFFKMSLCAYKAGLYRGSKCVIFIKILSEASPQNLLLLMHVIDVTV